MYFIKTCKKNILKKNRGIVSAVTFRLKKIPTYTFICFIACTLTLSLSSCTSSRKKTIEAHLSIEAAQQLNPDIDNANRPVNIKVLFLKNEKGFNKGSFSDLYQTPNDFLGNDLTHMEILQLLPGQKLTISETTSKEAKFIAVVAAFRDLNDLDWKAISPIPERCWACLKVASRDTLIMYLEGTKVSLSAKGDK